MLEENEPLIRTLIGEARRHPEHARQVILEVIDVSIVNVALTDMQGNLGATLAEIGWVVTGYSVANVIIIPLTAWLGERFGRKRYCLFSLAMFVAASLEMASAQVLREEAGAAKAGADFERAERLIGPGSGAISRSNFDAAGTAGKTAVAALEGARASLDAARAASDSAQARLQAGRAALHAPRPGSRDFSRRRSGPKIPRLHRKLFSRHRSKVRAPAAGQCPPAISPRSSSASR